MKPRSEKQMNRWKEVRSGGKWMFVVKFGLKFSLAMIASTLLSNWLFDSQVRTSAFSVALAVLAGIAVGLVIWWQNDADYQNQILDEKIQKGLEASN